MICEKCGKSNVEEAKFCEGCGSPLTDAPAADSAEPIVDAGAFSDVEPQNVPVKNNRKWIVLAGGAVLALIVLLCILASFGAFKAGYEKAVSGTLKGLQKGDSVRVYRHMLDPYMAAYRMDSDDDEQDLMDEYLDYIEDLRDDLMDQYGEHLKITYEIRKVTTFSRDEVRSIADYLEDHYDYDAGKVQDVVQLRVRLKMKGDISSESETTDIVVLKVKGKWYWSQHIDEYDIEEALEEY